jgi:protease I
MDSPLAGKRVAVLAENMYEDMELWYPLIRLREAGAEVSVVAPTAGATYKSKHGLEVKADMSAEDAKPRQFDAVIIPGGFAPDYMRRSEAMVRFVRDAYEEGKVVGAICHAGSMLVSAQVLKGKTVTCYKSIKDDVTNAGGIYVDRAVVRDGDLITSRVPDDLPAFCREIISALSTKTAHRDNAAAPSPRHELDDERSLPKKGLSRLHFARLKIWKVFSVPSVIFSSR